MFMGSSKNKNTVTMTNKAMAVNHNIEPMILLSSVRLNNVILALRYNCQNDS